MAILSYSIEAEDLVIKRLFDAVVFRDSAKPGFFIDLGAFHPVIASNTYLFYTMGWRGLNVEPNPAHIGEFERLRPEDTTLNVAIANVRKQAAYHQFSNGLLNGFLSDDLVQHHIEHGETHLGSISIDCVAINDLLSEYVHRDIDLLNIDIETLEPSILTVWDWARWRPKVIAAEIHALTMDDVRISDAAQILTAQRYALMSRVFQTAIFADAGLLGR